MTRLAFLLSAVLLVLMLSSCANKEAASPAEKPHATVVMRDGAKVTGTVVSSTPAELTLAGDDNISRTIPTKQIKSLVYDEAGAAQAEAPARKRRAAGTPARSPLDPDTTHEGHYHPEQSVIQTKTYELPADTEFSVRTEETIDSGKAAEGQTYAAEVTNDMRDADGAVVIPRGSNAQIVILSASKGGHIRGASDLKLDLKSVSVEGQEYQLSTTDVQQQGKAGIGANKRTAVYAGGGAAIGAIIGAIAGQGKGAAIGAGAGAGAGALAQILTKGGSIKVPAETILTFKLDQPLRVVASR